MVSPLVSPLRSPPDVLTNLNRMLNWVQKKKIFRTKGEHPEGTIRGGYRWEVDLGIGRVGSEISRDKSIQGDNQGITRDRDR